MEKAITIAPIEALLKSNAVDCNLTKQVNQSVSKDWEEEWTCQVNEDMKKIKPNMNTYTLNFAKNDINKAKTIIRQLYQHNWVFKLRDIKEKINNMIQNSGHPKVMIYIFVEDQFVKERLKVNCRSPRIFNLYTK